MLEGMSSQKCHTSGQQRGNGPCEVDVCKGIKGHVKKNYLEIIIKHFKTGVAGVFRSLRNRGA